jgi:nitrogen fixation NifU-like protein
MSSDLTDLYQEVILDHHRAPRNYGTLPGANRQARGHNPLCGDRLTLSLRVVDDRVEDVRFEGAGCAISRASASLMTDAVKGQAVGVVDALFERFHAMVTAPPEVPVDDVGMGKLAALAGVRAFPVRVKCASLAWHTLKAALASSAPAAVTTE